MRKLCNGSHKNVIEVLQYGELPESPYKYIDMELCLFTLQEYMDSNPIVVQASHHYSSLLRAAETWSIMVQMSDGLSFVHRNGEVHRDLKPQNGIVVFMLCH